MESQNRKIIWAIDAMDTNRSIDLHTFEAIQMLSSDHQYLIEPVYVHSPDPADIQEGYDPQWVNRSRNRARKSLALKLEKMGLLNSPEIHRLTVLIHSRPTITDSAKTLARYARNTGADMIAVATHARQGFSRLIWGSFAESLIANSKIPVLTVCPKAHISHAKEPKPKNILVPSDLSENSTPTFIKILKLAKDMHAKITLFHALPVPVGPMELPIPAETSARWIFEQWEEWNKAKTTSDEAQLLEQLTESARLTARQWLQMGRGHDIEMEIVIEPSREGVANSVLDHLEKNPAELVAMESHDTPLMAALAGSVTRTVERRAPCPVWISHS